MLANNFMDVTLCEASADFLVGMTLVVNRQEMLQGIERLMNDRDGAGLWESRSVIFEEWFRRWPNNDGGEEEMAGVVRLCCKWIGRWPWDERPAKLLVEKLGELEVELINRILPEDEYRTVVNLMAESSNRYVLKLYCKLSFCAL